MKKKIPKFDQKAWDEKQAKVAEEANGKSSFNPTDWLKRMSESYEKILGGQVILGQDKLIIPSAPKDKLSAQFPPNINVPAKTFPVLGSGYSPPKTNDPQPPFIIYDDFASDQYDKYLFGSNDPAWLGGEDGDRDKDLRLPQGHNDGSWYSYDPAFRQEERCCKPEDKVNIGFMQDKWACKVCGKDM